ncbi:probable potassium voltage-gated channel subfamily H member 7 [Coccomyxa sp. Obi]|nr:probable potassium voltage-gated channel subfamily H member 7 [Coccomyxa sp. Obi]
MGRLFEKRNNETLPQHANDVEAPRSDRCKKEEEDELGDDIGLVLLTEQEDQPYHKDEDTYQPTYLARELHVDKVGWDHFTKGRANRPLFWRVACLHAWRNLWSKQGITFDEVEDSVHHRDQQELDNKEGAPERRHRCRCPTIHPLSRVAMSWYFFMTLVDATYTAFIVPLGVAFHFKAIHFSWYNAIDIAAGVCYWFDIFMGFSTGFVVIYNLRRKVIRDRALIAEYYIRYSTFIVDLLAALPVIAEIVVLPIPMEPGGMPLHIILIMRLARMWHVIKFLERLVFISLIGSVNRLLMRHLSIGHIFFINVTFGACVLLNFLTCCWYYIATLEGLQNSWLTSVNKMDISSASAARQWVASLYFVVMTITTVGYGDVGPINAFEEIMASLLMLLGVIIFGFVISSSQQLIKFLSVEARRAGKLRKKLARVETWLRQRRISQTITRRIRAYYAEVWLPYTEVNDEDFWTELPAALRTDMALELARPLFAHSDIFKALDDSAERQVAARLQPSMVPAGHNVTQEGDDADALYLLQEGELLIMRHTEEVRLVTAPAIVGESVLLNLLPDGPHVRPVTLRAISPCMLWVLTIRDLEHIFNILPELRHKLIEMFERRMKMNLRHAPEDERAHWESLLRRASELAHQMEPGGASGGGPESLERTSEESEAEKEALFQGDVEAIPDDNISQSGQLMTVGRALRDVPEYLKPWASFEQQQRPRLKDVCFANHPGRTSSMSFAEARSAAAGTAAPGSPSAAAASMSVPRSAAMSASMSAPLAWNAPVATLAPIGVGLGERRRSSLRSNGENQGARASQAEGLERHNTDWAEPSPRRMQNAALAGPAIGRTNRQNGLAYRIQSPFGAPQRRSNHRQQDGVELSGRGRSRRTANGSSSSGSSNGSAHGGSSRGHHSGRGSQPRLTRSSGGASRSRRGADSLGTPMTQQTSGGRTRDPSARGGNEQVVDSERENPAGDAETVGEAHTEELRGGGQNQQRTLEDALSSIPQPLRRTMHS